MWIIKSLFFVFCLVMAGCQCCRMRPEATGAYPSRCDSIEVDYEAEKDVPYTPAPQFVALRRFRLSEKPKADEYGDKSRNLASIAVSPTEIRIVFHRADYIKATFHGFRIIDERLERQKKPIPSAVLVSSSLPNVKKDHV